VSIHLLGVNAAGEESGDSLAVQGRTLPWLQDTPAADVWKAWAVGWRDVVILDQGNRRIAVYNLTAHDLSVAANYDSLKTLLVNAAR
jgi:hypothetical protein